MTGLHTAIALQAIAQDILTGQKTVSDEEAVFVLNDVAKYIHRVFSARPDTAYGLTSRQYVAMEFVQRYIDEHGFSPNFAEVAEATGQKSKSGVHRLLRGLELRGYIARIPCRNRSISVLRRLPVKEAA